MSTEVAKQALIADRNEILASTDSKWLLGQLQESLESSVRHIVRMSLIVRRLDELGVQVELPIASLPYLRKIAHGNLSAELFVALDGHNTLLRAASTLPAPDQEKIAKNEPIKVMGLNGDHSMVPPLSMTTAQIAQVFGFGRIRSDAEQVGHLREKLQDKDAAAVKTVGDSVRIDRKRKGIIVGQTFIPLVVLQQHVAELTKRRSRAAV